MNQDRLVELARDAAKQAHAEGFTCDGHVLTMDGYFGFDTCPHPDCLLVRDAARQDEPLMPMPNKARFSRRARREQSDCNPPRRAWHDSDDWIERAAAAIRDLNPEYEAFEAEVASIIRAARREAPEPKLRAAWEEGFKLCRSYGDNHHHFYGEQKERQWQAYLKRSAVGDAPEQGKDVSHENETTLAEQGKDVSHENETTLAVRSVREADAANPSQVGSALLPELPQEILRGKRKVAVGEPPSGEVLRLLRLWLTECPTAKYHTLTRRQVQDLVVGDAPVQGKDLEHETKTRNSERAGQREDRRSSHDRRRPSDAEPGRGDSGRTGRQNDGGASTHRVGADAVIENDGEVAAGEPPSGIPSEQECGRCGHTALHHAMYGSKDCQHPTGCACHEFILPVGEPPSGAPPATDYPDHPATCATLASAPIVDNEIPNVFDDPCGKSNKHAPSHADSSTGAPPALDLDAIKSREQAATKGPWKMWNGFGPCVDGLHRVERFGTDGGASVLSTERETATIAGQKEDWEFIAHAREDIPALLAALARGRAGAQPAEGRCPTCGLEDRRYYEAQLKRLVELEGAGVRRQEQP